MQEISLGSIATVNESKQIVARVGAFTEYESQLAVLEKEAEGGLVFDCSDPKQDKAARDWRRQLVTMRVDVERARKESTRTLDVVKAAFMDSQRAIERRIAPLEEMADAPIKAEEERKAEIKAEAERKEAARVQAIQDAISEIRTLPHTLHGKPSADVRKAIETMTARDIRTTEFSELFSAAATAKNEALALLETILQVALNREESERKAEQDRIELEKLRAEQEETAKKQAEADRIVRAEQERVAKENAEALRVANAKIAEQEERERQAQAKIEEQERQIEANRAEEQRRQAELSRMQNEVATRTETNEPARSFPLGGVTQEQWATAVKDATIYPSLSETLEQIVAMCEQKPTFKLLANIKSIAQAAIERSELS